MPKRTRVNDELVLSVYREQLAEQLAQGKKTGAIRKAAQLLNIHENTLRKSIRRDADRCTRCNVQIVRTGQTSKMCSACRKWAVERQKERKRECLRKGICYVCNAPVAPPSRRYCEQHRLAEIEASVRYAAKRGALHPGIPTKQRKERHLREKYGDAGVQIWNELQATCVMCSATVQERAIHIHHKDGNHDNNSKDNLTCLCFYCHQLTHQLLAHPDPLRALTWIRQTYPDMPI